MSRLDRVAKAKPIVRLMIIQNGFDLTVDDHFRCASFLGGADHASNFTLSRRRWVHAFKTWTSKPSARFWRFFLLMEIREVLGAAPVSTALHFRPTRWQPPQAGKGHAPKASRRWRRYSNLASVHPLLSCHERRHRLSRWAAERGTLPET